MNPDDLRNILIVEVGKQTGQGKELQALINIDLVLQGLSHGRPGTSLVQPHTFAAYCWPDSFGHNKRRVRCGWRRKKR